MYVCRESEYKEVTLVGMVNSFQLNGMEILGFPSAEPPAPFRGTGPAV